MSDMPAEDQARGGEGPDGPPAWAAPGSTPPGYPTPDFPGAASAARDLAGPPLGSPHTATPAQPPPLQLPPPPQLPWTTAFTAHKPGIIPLRPLGFTDILDGAFAATRRNPRTFFGLALVTSLVVVGVLALLAAVAYLLATQLPGGASDTLLAVGALGGLTVMYLFSAVTSVALTGMLSYPVGEGVLGRRPSIGETWRHTRAMIPRLAGLCLLLMLPVVLVVGALVGLVVWAVARDSPVGGAVAVLGFLAVVVGIVTAGVRVALATPALVLEDIGVVAALRRSWALTSRRFWRTLGVLLLAAVLVAIVQQVLGFGFQLLGLVLGVAVTATSDGGASDAAMFAIVMASSVVGGLVAALVAQPFQAGVVALLYTDARIRREGFDLALARAATGAPVAG
ncbi:glycerophosphoryl diester phosphodiesterase membrane domain-containing protein [Pedococcus sp. 5OH_020]|uniref:glycerophosphoryl diester phosphodiesterase membrane domain-containing protein n=1 Tax=Pedococcus sp. 5OH_020 TaxID=2989814 RepID=UPI0022E9AEBA|nr:glycerophosphoryl diester phosphodiesterase membrane domain-containing protein [Pedococcus sp. 5OH_020]